MAVQTVKLLDPVIVRIRDVHGGERDQSIDTLEFDFPDDGVLRAKHLRFTDGHSGLAGMTIALIALFTGHPLRVVEEISERDFIRCYEVIEGFRSPGGQTGEPS